MLSMVSFEKIRWPSPGTFRKGESAASGFSCSSVMVSTIACVRRSKSSACFNAVVTVRLLRLEAAASSSAVDGKTKSVISSPYFSVRAVLKSLTMARLFPIHQNNFLLQKTQQPHVRGFSGCDAFLLGQVDQGLSVGILSCSLFEMLNGERHD